MEFNDDKLVEDIVIDEHFNPDEMLLVLTTAFSQTEKEIIVNLLLNDFKGFFLGASVVNFDLCKKKARFVSCFGYTTRVNFYYAVKTFIISHLQNEIKPHVLNATKNTFLKLLTTAWEIYLEALTKVNDVMDYMENIHSEPEKLEYFDKFGIILFRSMIFQDEEVERRFQQSLSEMRQVTVLDSVLLNHDRLLIEDVSKMCNLLKMNTIYECNVKPLFMTLTTEYFQSISEDYLFQYCACGYFKNVDAKIIEEMDRIQSKLDTKSVNEIIDIIKTKLVMKNMKIILEMQNCGVVYMLKNNKHDDLKWIYNFLSSVNGGVKVMFDSMCPYFRKVGILIVQDKKWSSDGIACIQNLLNLKEKFDNLMINLFNNDNLFDEIVGGEFSFFLKFNSLIPKFLSIFIDLQLRKERYMIIKSNVNANIDKVMFLIKHLQEKSIFEHFYQSHLAERLLCYRNVSIKIENRMIKKLKKVYVNGYSNSLFISRIKGMFNDKFVSSKTIIHNYNEYVSVNKCILGILQPFDLSVEVISSEYWPITNPKSICKVPSIALSAFNDFKTYYSKGETKKTLKLLPQFGTVELNATFYGASKSTKQSCDGESSTNNQCVEQNFKIVVTTYQMFVLDLFNTNESLSYKEILKETMIPEKSLINALQGLVHFHHLLIKNSVGREIESNDKFYINEFFEPK